MTPERYRRLRAVLDRRQPDLAVILDGVHKPHNIAAIARTCDAVGVLDLHTVLPNNRARPRALNAMGSQRWVSVHRHDTGPDAVRHLRGQGMQVLAAHFSAQAVCYREVDFTRPTALLLGTEKFGVTQASSTCVDQHITIPMMGMVSSFNVSVAAAIILAEACEQRRRAGLYQRPARALVDYDQVLFRWAHPRIAAHCQRFGVTFPALDPGGHIADPKRFDFALSQAILRHQAGERVMAP